MPTYLLAYLPAYLPASVACLPAMPLIVTDKIDLILAGLRNVKDDLKHLSMKQSKMEERLDVVTSGGVTQTRATVETGARHSDDDKLSEGKRKALRKKACDKLRDEVPAAPLFHVIVVCTALQLFRFSAGSRHCRYRHTT